AMTLPVFLIGMSRMIPALAGLSHSRGSRWLEFLLATPTILWAGWPFFVRGANSVRNRHWNMFTLIARGVGTAWLYSVIAFFAPGIFPLAMRPDGMVDTYFEVSAVIVVLVLLGQVLELRARANTSSA